MIKKSLNPFVGLRIYVSLLLVLVCVALPLSSLAKPSPIDGRIETPGANYRLPEASTLLATPTPTPMPPPLAYDIAPSGGRQGKEYEVVVTSNECTEDISQDPPKANPRNPLKDLDLYAPDGSGIKVTNSTATDCRVTAKLSLANDAPVGAVKLWLIDKKRVPRIFVDFAVTGITAGPIPPGLNDKGQVDVMWSVLPDQVVHDNFGAKVATEYFCIDAVIGNDSGYDLQIASIGFTAPTLSPDAKKPRYRVPNTGYRVVRGTLQRRELLSPRNLILNGIKVAGPLLTGFLPFFHNMVHTTNFSELINIISNPLEKGFESAVPDTVPFQVNRLDDQTFRDDIATRTVIPNNIQTRVMTFVPKELFFSGSKGGFLKRRKPGETSKNASGDTADRHNPKDVMQMLGDIVIIGEQIEHVNRIRVVSTGLETQPADRSISGKITDRCNVGVGGVTMTISSGSDFTSRDVTTSADGTYTFVNIPIGRTYTVTPKLENMTFNPTSPGSETFTLNGTRTNLDFTADYTVLVITGKIAKKDSTAISGVSVALMPTDPTTPKSLAQTVTTNDAGVFRFELSGSKVQLPGATLSITPDVSKLTNVTLDAPSKSWMCTQRNVDFSTPK